MTHRSYPSNVLMHGYLAPTFAMTQSLVELRMRALAASILLFILSIIGPGLGPQITCTLSDVINLTTDLGVDSLRWAMVAVLVFNIIAAVLYIMAGRTVNDDLRQTA